MTTFLAQNQFNSEAHVPVASGSAGVNAQPPSTAPAAPIEDRLDWRAFWDFIMDDRIVLLTDELPLFLQRSE